MFYKGLYTMTLGADTGISDTARKYSSKNTVKKINLIKILTLLLYVKVFLKKVLFHFIF